MFLIYQCVSHKPVCFSYTSVFLIYQCVSHIPVCFSYTRVFLIHQCVSHTPVCFSYTSVFLIHQCVSHTPVCFSYTSVFLIHQCVSHTPVCFLYTSTVDVELFQFVQEQMKLPLLMFFPDIPCRDGSLLFFFIFWISSLDDDCKSLTERFLAPTYMPHCCLVWGKHGTKSLFVSALA